MKLRVLGCYGGSVKGSHLSCFLLGDSVVLEAGSLTQTLLLEEQLKIRHVLVSHSHLDHNGSLPFFAINVYGRVQEPVTIYGTAPVLKGLREHMFNDVLWPDFSRLPSNESPTFRFQEIRPGETFELAGMRFTPIPVNHITPTVGFLVEQDGGAVLYTSDTGPTEEVWRAAGADERVRAIITEASFPNDQQELAEASGHMTPRMLGRELQKVGRPVRILVTHMKPGHEDQIERELRALGLQEIELLEQGRTYEL